MTRRASDRSPAKVKHADHLRLWAIVEGAVVDAFNCHPEYLTERGHRSAVESVTKRVVGQLVGVASVVREDGRLGASCEAGLLGRSSSCHATGSTGTAANGALGAAWESAAPSQRVLR